MRKLIGIGFWNDGSDDCPLHNPQEFVDEHGDPELRDATVHYLARGAPCATYLGTSWCRFDCGIDDLELGTSDLTDGVWMWPSGLSHYVEEHDVCLPDEFVEHARERGFRVFCGGLEQPARGDLAFWLEWCGKHSSRDPAAVAMWRRTPEEIAARRPRILEQLVDQYGGLGEATCSWAGCSKPVLKRLAFCAECAHTRMNLWP